MILYFLRTGNNEYTMKRIGEEINDRIMNPGEKIRSCDFSGTYSDASRIVVALTYTWKIPRILQGQLEKTELTGNKNIYFAMACGGNTGNAGRYLKKLTDAKGLSYQGHAQIIISENYIAMSTTPTREEAAGIIRRSQSAIDKATRQIRLDRSFPQVPVTRKDKTDSGTVNDIFYSVLVRAKESRTTGARISCGKCVNSCLSNNIRLESGFPTWGRGCTHCMAYISHCLNQTIGHGKHTRNLPHYTCPQNRG